VVAVFAGERERIIEFQMPTSAGSRHFQSRVVPELGDDGEVETVLSVTRDVSIHRWTEEALLRRDAVLEAVSIAAGRFLRSTDWRSSMQHVMRQLGEATKVSRVSMFENTRGADGVLRTGQQMEWVADGVEPQIDNPELSDLSFAEPDLNAWKETLEQGGILCQDVDELGGELRRLLEPQGIRSVVLVPIFVGAEWWGFIGFDECRGPRQWPAVELDALRMAADTLGAAIHRQQTEDALRRSEEQLRQAQKMEAVGRLAGGIAHDFNNMLTAISGFASLLRSEMDDADERVEYVDEIEKAAVRSADLTRQLLAYSRQQIRQPHALNLNAVVTRISGMLRRVISEDIRLESVLAPDLESVDADAGQVEQMIMNLVINARDAITGGGLVQILTRNSEVCEAEASRLGCMARPGTYVVLSVCDTGCGMDAETSLRLFEPFYTTKGVGEGTGLGLATVHGIVEQNEGFIRLRTAPGRGTTFDVYLPRVTPQAKSQAPG